MGSRPYHRRPAAPDGAGVTGDRRIRRPTCPSIPVFTSRRSSVTPAWRSQAAGRFRLSNDAPSRVASSTVLMSVHAYCDAVDRGSARPLRSLRSLWLKVFYIFPADLTFFPTLFVSASPRSSRARSTSSISCFTTSGCCASTFVVSPTSASRSNSESSISRRTCTCLECHRCRRTRAPDMGAVRAASTCRDGRHEAQRPSRNRERRAAPSRHACRRSPARRRDHR